MTKQEVIKQAYGEHWESVKDYLNENGWCSSKWCAPENITIREFLNEQSDGRWGWRPSSLKGLETNNGWIKIESEKDLPESGYYEVVLRSTKETTRGSITHSKPKAMVAYYSHYQPIKEMEKPLY